MRGGGRTLGPGLAGPGCWRTAGALVPATPLEEKLLSRVLGSAPGRPRIRESAPAKKGVDRTSGGSAMSPDMALYWACSVLSLSGVVVVVNAIVFNPKR